MSTSYNPKFNPADGPVEILKYPNRKLYLPDQGYIGVAGVAEIVRSGKSVKITHSETGTDETLFVLSSLIHSEVSKAPADKNVKFPRYSPSDLEDIIRKASR